MYYSGCGPSFRGGVLADVCLLLDIICSSTTIRDGYYCPWIPTNTTTADRRRYIHHHHRVLLIYSLLVIIIRINDTVIIRRRLFASHHDDSSIATTAERQEQELIAADNNRHNKLTGTSLLLAASITSLLAVTSTPSPAFAEAASAGSGAGTAAVLACAVFAWLHYLGIMGVASGLVAERLLIQKNMSLEREILINNNADGIYGLSAFSLLFIGYFRVTQMLQKDGNIIRTNQYLFWLKMCSVAVNTGRTCRYFQQQYSSEEIWHVVTLKLDLLPSRML